MWPLGFVPLVPASKDLNCIIFPSLEEIYYIPLTGRYTVILTSIEAASVISTAIRILKTHVTTEITDSILAFPWFWTFTLCFYEGIISHKMKRLGQVVAYCVQNLDNKINFERITGNVCHDLKQWCFKILHLLVKWNFPLAEFNEISRKSFSQTPLGAWV